MIAIDVASAATDLGSHRRRSREARAAVRHRLGRCLRRRGDDRRGRGWRCRTRSARRRRRQRRHPCAGAPTWEITEEAWQRTLDVNLTGVWHTIKAGVPHIGESGGSVVIISSTNGLRGTANTAHYTASKHAVVGLGAHARQRAWPTRDPGEHRASRRRGHRDGAQRGDIQTAAARPVRTRQPTMPPRSSRRAICFRCRGWSPSTSPTPWCSWPLTRPATSPGLSSSSMPGLTQKTT